MGEMTEMILNGVCCQICGDYLGDGVGHPMTCDYCHQEIMKWELESEIEQK